MRIAILEGPGAPWRGEAVADQVGLVIAGLELWCGDDLAGVVMLEADADELALLAATEIRLGWLT